MVTAQNLLLTLIGLVPGLVFGWLLAWVFMDTFSSDMFTFELHMRPLTFVLTAVAIIVVGLLSASGRRCVRWAGSISGRSCAIAPSSGARARVRDA